MTAIAPTHAPAARRPFWMPSRQTVPLLMTLVVFVLMYLAGCWRFEAFRSAQVIVNLLTDNAFLGVAAIGMTFVILSGGIDLSVGAAIGCTSIFIASMVETHGWHPALAIAAALVGGTLVGFVQGSLISLFAVQPFLITLGGLFFYRGVGLLISREQLSLTHELYNQISLWGWQPTDSLYVPAAPFLFLGILLVAIYVAHFLPAGRSIYAVGGDEQSALLMGLPVRRTKIAVYAISGFCAALAGVTSTVAQPSGDALRGAGLELDAIAAVVVGGTLLSGGVGGPVGTLLGILIFGLIQTAINFEGTLSSWWARIVVGLLLLGFILIQTLLQPRENHA